MPTGTPTAVSTAPSTEDHENPILEDDEYLTTNTCSADNDAPTSTEIEAVETELTLEQQAALRIQQAKLGMAWSISTILANTPEIADVLHLNTNGAEVSTEVTVNGTTYEVIWKVKGIEGIESNAVIPPPLTLTMKCKYGRHCLKGTSCPFDHSIKPKLCNWVNTLMGCTNGTACTHSHEHEGANCTRSRNRRNCANGKACAYRHSDDVYKSGEMRFTKPVQTEKVYGDGKEEREGDEREEVKNTQPAVIPTRPDMGKEVGQKRVRRGESSGRPAQRPRVDEQLGRGKGRGRGSGGVGRGGRGMRLKGAAK